MSKTSNPRETQASNIPHASEDRKPEPATLTSSSRRSFLRAGTRLGAVTVTASSLKSSAAQAKRRARGPRRMTRNGPSPYGDQGPIGDVLGRPNWTMRSAMARQLKRRFAQDFRQDAQHLSEQLTNSDEVRFKEDRYYASFCKTLPCNRFGEVEPSAYRSFLHAVSTGKSEDFAKIPQDPSAQRKLANPQGSFKYSLSSMDSHETRIAHSHSCASAALAGELVEVYWKALLRDLSFDAYDTNHDVERACQEIQNLSVIPGAHGQLQAQNLFRGETRGDVIGPYISQFLYHDVPFGSASLTQRYLVPVAGSDFMLDEDSWLDVQRGIMPSARPRMISDKRYIYNGRSLAEFVHNDFSYQAYLQAALILLGWGQGALAQENPYARQRNQEAFVSHGPTFALDLVARAANLALCGGWFQKWEVHRVFRPEVMGARAHYLLTGKRRHYQLHDDLLSSKALERVFSKHGTYLLPQAYPEGSPVHPSYPAGHACVAGACVTVLKALFNESFAIPRPVVARSQGTAIVRYNGATLRVGNELDKLANNIALGRDFAGVHYRQDSLQGLYLGEQVAIGMLREESVAMNESGFAGFSLRDFDGNQVRIEDGQASWA